jgi:hypothetical protein
MPTAADTPDWWEQVFNQKEAEQLERTARQVVHLHEEHVEDRNIPIPQDFVEVSMYVPVEQFQDILQGIRNGIAYTPRNEVWYDFLWLIGECLALEYVDNNPLWDTPDDPDDPLGNLLAMFLPEPDGSGEHPWGSM